MNNKIMQIPISDFLESLKSGYEEYRNALEKNHDESDLSHIKGFCNAIEQILTSYGDVSKVEILDIKKPIIGNISLKRKTPAVNYDVPTYKRNQQD